MYMCVCPGDTSVFIYLYIIYIYIFFFNAGMDTRTLLFSI